MLHGIPPLRMGGLYAQIAPVFLYAPQQSILLCGKNPPR
jgi:hypothetical protein